MYDREKLGIKAENHLMSILNNLGIPHEKINRQYDLKVYDEMVEIKSTKMCIKCNQNKLGYRIGRYEFRGESQRSFLKINNVWVCFIIRYGNQYVIQGFLKPKEFLKDDKLSYSIHEIHKLKPIKMIEWLRRVNL